MAKTPINTALAAERPAGRERPGSPEAWPGHERLLGVDSCARGSPVPCGGQTPFAPPFGEGTAGASAKASVLTHESFRAVPRWTASAGASRFNPLETLHSADLSHSSL